MRGCAASYWMVLGSPRIGDSWGLCKGPGDAQPWWVDPGGGGRGRAGSGKEARLDSRASDSRADADPVLAAPGPLRAGRSGLRAPCAPVIHLLGGGASTSTCPSAPEGSELPRRPLLSLGSPAGEFQGACRVWGTWPRDEDLLAFARGKRGSPPAAGTRGPCPVLPPSTAPPSLQSSTPHVPWAPRWTRGCTADGLACWPQGLIPNTAYTPQPGQE